MAVVTTNLTNINDTIDTFSARGQNLQTGAWQQFDDATRPSGTGQQPSAADVTKAAGQLTIGLSIANRVFGAVKEVSDNFNEIVRGTK